MSGRTMAYITNCGSSMPVVHFYHFISNFFEFFDTFFCDTFSGIRQEQDVYVRLIDSVTKQVISSCIYLCFSTNRLVMREIL